MLARLSLVMLGLSLMPGCSGRKGAVDPGVLAEMTGTINERPPPRNEPSRYDFRGGAALVKNSSTVIPVKGAQEESASPPEPQPPVQVEKPPENIPPSLEQEPPTFDPNLFPDTGSVPSAPPVLITSMSHSPPAKPTDPLVTAFISFRAGKTAEGLDHLKKVDPTTREMLVVLLPLAARLSEVCKSGGPRDYSSLLDTLDLLAQAIRPRSALTMEKMCFCRGIEKFGVYHPLPAEHPFQPAVENRPGELVRVYLELRNFASIRNGDFNETSLACTLEIHDQRKKVWRQDRPAQTEQSRSPRRDLHLGCYFHVPKELPPGDYTLWIHVKDVTGLSGDAEVPLHRIAGRSLPFQVRDSSLVRATDPTAD